MAKTPKDPVSGRRTPDRRTIEDEPQIAPGGGSAVAAAGGRPAAARPVDARLVDAEPAIAPPPDDDPGLPGRPGRDDVEERKPGADLLREDGSASSTGSRERLGTRPFADSAPSPGIDRPGAVEAGVFDLLDQPGATDGDPLSNFLGAAEGRLGRGTGLSDPSDQTNASPAHGQQSVAAEGDPLGPETLEQF
ncbi:MAG TPA: hypothetical protein VD926_06930, partial [Acidimicrobiales bacterium]|nr:hypothetical protein [Acidimicrobiales bacterium]